MDREVLGGLLDEYDAVRAKLAAFDYGSLTAVIWLRSPSGTNTPTGKMPRSRIRSTPR